MGRTVCKNSQTRAAEAQAARESGVQHVPRKGPEFAFDAPYPRERRSHGAAKTRAARESSPLPLPGYSEPSPLPWSPQPPPSPPQTRSQTGGFPPICAGGNAADESKKKGAGAASLVLPHGRFSLSEHLRLEDFSVAPPPDPEFIGPAPSLPCTQSVGCCTCSCPSCCPCCYSS